MKKIISAVLILFLAGCQTETASLESRLEKEVTRALNVEVNGANNRKAYYSYYLDPSVGRISSTGTGNVFSLNGTSFVMNLDVASIINEKYWPDSASGCADVLNGELLASCSGTYMDPLAEEQTYTVNIYQYEQDRVMVSAVCGYMRFASLADPSNAPSIAGKMIEISRTVSVECGEVLAAYTTKEGIDYAGTPVELFEEKAPENGTIEELLVGYDGTAPQPESENGEAEDEGLNNN